ncbi:AAA family ATPase [Corallococcus sp. BB11-1]|uniref:AAA family ATPase n=1 Tax=Corallococcus sp. BB11-1 TaxID=2996783 RepID=UPI0010EA09CE|nr:ATP-binding protein [Corallococcus sp. BB11-1]MCY1036394.1 AAA family ATPase [Corallococcus sp. BB11-1]RYZ17997.1 MAG: ATPase [Myxococcaceae bacterium]
MLPIENLTIHRLRGLRDVQLSDCGRVNVLVGRNNSGKTTVLEAVALHARPLSPGDWVEAVRRRDLTNSRSALIEGLRWLFPHTQENGSGDAGPFVGTVHLSGQGRLLTREARAHFKELEGYAVGTEEPPSGFATEILTLHDSGIRRGASLEFQATLTDTDAAPVSSGPLPSYEERFTVTLWETGRGPIAQFPQGAASPVATVTPFSHRFQQLEVEAFSDAVFSDLKPTVLDLLKLFDSDIEDLEILKRPRNDAAIYMRHRRLGMAPLNTFGDGMRRVLLMGLSVAAVQGGLLLIDEIESAIHTKALDAAFRWLIRACQQLDVQLFATTHSLEAVDALLAASTSSDELVIYRLESKAEGIRAKRFSQEQLLVLREELGQEIRV